MQIMIFQENNRREEIYTNDLVIIEYNKQGMRYNPYSVFNRRSINLMLKSNTNANDVLKD